MHKYLVVLLLVSSMSFSQKIYKDSIFSKIIFKTYTYKIYDKDTLELDFYKAKNNKDLSPLVVVVHGGGFSGGMRDEPIYTNFAKSLAGRGYAVASISYRLTMKGIGFGCNIKANDKIEAINAASEDTSLAVKYLVENAETLGIDANKVILLGSSAGAEAVLNLAFIYRNNVLPSNFSFAGLISLAGALVSLDNITSDTAMPLQLFHGTGDRLVPYNIAPHHYCKKTRPGFLMLYGSKAISNRLDGLGKPYYLYSVEGGTHDWASIPFILNINEMTDFLYHDVINPVSIRQTKVNIKFDEKILSSGN